MDRNWLHNYRIGVVVFALVSAALLFAVIEACDYTTNQTANGLWKIGLVESWMRNSPFKFADDSMVLYFPVSGFIARCLPFGDGVIAFSKKIAVTNALFAGLAIGLTFLLLYHLTLDSKAAAAGAIFQLGCAFFLLLSTISEDVMPAYTFFVAAVAFAIMFARSRRYWWLFLSAQMYTISWLFHWTLIVAGPSIILALLIMRGTARQRCDDGLRFLYLCFPAPLLCAWYFKIPLLNIFFPGKGMQSGWAGFSAYKLGYLFAGIGQYFMGGKNLVFFQWIFEPLNMLVGITGWGVALALGFVFFRTVKLHWQEPAWRAAGVIFAGTLVAAEFMNIYSQPQDPQMQLQPMSWLAVAFGVFVLSASKTKPYVLQKKQSFFKHSILLSFVPLIINLSLLLSQRGGDSHAVRAVRQLEESVDPARTVFITQGFDYMTVWAHVLWEPRQRHIVALSNAVVFYPYTPAEEIAAAVRSKIEQALAQGYQLVAGPVWQMSEQEFIGSLLTVGEPEKSKALYRAFKHDFEGVPLLDTHWGRFYVLQYKKGGL